MSDRVVYFERVNTDLRDKQHYMILNAAGELIGQIRRNHKADKRLIMESVALNEWTGEQLQEVATFLKKLEANKP